MAELLFQHRHDSSRHTPRVVLVQPPIEDFYTTPLRRQPLGLLSLAAVARQQGWEACLINGHSPKKRPIALPREFDYLRPFMEHRDPGLRFPFRSYYHFGLSFQEMQRRIRALPARLYALSLAFTPYHREGETILEMIRSEHPHTPIVIGGPHATLHHNYYLEQGLADYVILGEGEEALARLLDYLNDADADLEAIPNLVFRGRQHPPALQPVRTLDALPFPARDLLLARDMKMYGRAGVSLLFSRGCPHACAFCSSRAVFGRGNRRRSSANLIQEIDYCWNQFGTTVFNFEDDHLFADPDACAVMLQQVIHYQQRHNIRFDLCNLNGSCLETLDNSLLTLMRRAGFRSLDLSLVSAGEAVQQGSRRPFDSPGFTTVVQEAHRLGMHIRAYFILGLPRQNKEEIEDTIALLQSLPVLPVPSVYYDVMRPEPDHWMLQRSAAFANETRHLQREDLIRYFNQATGRQ